MANSSICVVRGERFPYFKAPSLQQPWGTRDKHTTLSP